MDSITIQHLSWGHPDASALREAQQLEIDVLRPRGLDIAASAANVPIFLVAFDGTEPIACGGLRPLFSVGLPEQAEIKRMYVTPSWRASDKSKAGRNTTVARQVLEALETVAVEHGWTNLKVETSLAMAQARRFYEKYGYMQCALFGAYEGCEGLVCYEKSLV